MDGCRVLSCLGALEVKGRREEMEQYQQVKMRTSAVATLGKASVGLMGALVDGEMGRLEKLGDENQRQTEPETGRL